MGNKSKSRRMSAQLDIETASPTSPRSPTSLIGHAADENSEDTNRGLISGHLRTGLGFTKKALGLGITLLLVGAVVLLALNYSATTEISEGNVLSSSKDHKPLKTASLHYIINHLEKYTESHDLKELFGTLEHVTVTSADGTMDKVKATESHLSADGNKLTLTGATGSKAVIEKLHNGKVVVMIEKANTKAWTPPKTAKTTGGRRSMNSFTLRPLASTVLTDMYSSMSVDSDSATIMSSFVINVCTKITANLAQGQVDATAINNAIDVTTDMSDNLASDAKTAVWSATASRFPATVGAGCLASFNSQSTGAAAKMTAVLESMAKEMLRHVAYNMAGQGTVSTKYIRRTLRKNKPANDELETLFEGTLDSTGGW